MSSEEARQLMARLLGTDNPVTVFQFEFGWAAQETLSPRQRAQGRQLGQGVFIIDQTGVVTAHPSLPPPLIIKRYAAARREGRITGRQIWPVPDPTG
ncbi:hypothetical protein D2L64_23565 [Micromonospora radicis]|uniref:Immunity protein 35 domain-containing protein n=1 Tax=Micromonospora radicis TaxID=1894971 RepID=A0A418MPG5_9ACTN|nr:hypothetical protein D2L64_23565 [Micromonospora radicis]